MRGQPWLLDLYCGAGGAAAGYVAAGFRVLGVDLEPQPDYPYEFMQADVLGWDGEEEFFSQFDAIHASPPCQAHTTMSNRDRGHRSNVANDNHADLIPATRDILIATGLPYVIENVGGARKSLIDPFVLTGGMFGLKVHRPRLFESNMVFTTPPKCGPPEGVIGVYGHRHDGRLLWTRKDGTEQRAAKTLAEAQEAMGMPWASWRGCAEAIPPAYTKWIGDQLFAAVTS